MVSKPDQEQGGSAVSILAIDVGGTNIKYALVDREDRFFSRGVIPTAIRSLDDFRATIMRIYEPLKEQVEGIAFSMPGIIDAQTGFMYSGGSLSWIHNIAMAGEVSGFLSGVPVSIENDAKAAALAELESCSKANGIWRAKSATSVWREALAGAAAVLWGAGVALLPCTGALHVI